MLVVTLQEHHGARFQDGEFDWMAKDCFYAGLWQEHKALVAHLKDQDQMELVKMLKALWEIEESQYPASTSAKLAQPKTMDRYGYNSHHNHRKKMMGTLLGQPLWINRTSQHRRKNLQ